MSSGMKITLGVLVLVALVGVAAFYFSGPKGEQNQTGVTTQKTPESATKTAAPVATVPPTGNIDDVMVALSADATGEQSAVAAEEQDAASISADVSAASSFDQAIDENAF